MSTPNSSALVVAMPAQFALGQRPFQCAAVLGQIARAIGRHALGEIRGDVLESCPRTQRSQLRAATRAYERQRSRALGDEVGHHPRGLGTGRTPYRSAVFADDVLAQRRLPQRDRPCALRGAIVGDLCDGLPMSSDAVAAGCAVVALAKITVGAEE